MSSSNMTGMQHAGHGVMPAVQAGDSGMRWTLNGKVFPDTDLLPVKIGQVAKVRFWNKDVQGMHPMDHPIHVHGAYFQVISLNGKSPVRETWKDTINVPAAEYVDVAFVMQHTGEWMLHCHILDHEDGGMMTVITAR
jgi:FtsP/CotA-like multicopper oxidase with cupredoxin domain